MHSKTKTKRCINYKRVLFVLAVAALGTLMFMLPVLADTVSAKTVMGSLISLMCSMFKFVGAGLFVWAVIQFILATKRSDADSKSDAIQTGVCGIALMSVAVIVKSMGIGKAIGGNDEIDITDDSLDG